ncbi:outer membrane beta-barrel protein [Candidatus Thiothrix sp. Deng01]|uniref:Outer membrane beta-barrel protein n=1 Tax=Candidatus Thiothrix phosphatis TaxID=3112415 RepID=A0ABU6D3B6_9GAMM|nr:outer membrane beta-barrel protein [Candidatus Thiothrix sp. Deng01]MEB4592837.1 outer membrane beta-barrel protein [Candidatus Thiothrix sp. Deng01]
MNNRLALCLLLGLMGAAQADDAMMMGGDFSTGPKMYVGTSVGSSKQGDTCNDPFFEGGCNNQDLAWKAFGGVRFNPMFGAELGYYDLGDSSLNGSTGGAPAKLETSTTGTAITGVGYVPLTSQIEAFGKAGAIAWDQKHSKLSGTTASQSAESGTSALLGGGAQYQLNSNLFLRGEWEHMFNIGSDSAYETDADLYSVGVSYSTL